LRSERPMKDLANLEVSRPRRTVGCPLLTPGPTGRLGFSSSGGYGPGQSGGSAFAMRTAPPLFLCLWREPPWGLAAPRGGEVAVPIPGLWPFLSKGRKNGALRGRVRAVLD